MKGFESSYARLFQLAYRVSYRVLGSREEALDCAQESLVRALVRWRKISDYAESWVVRVASNLAIDTLRKRAIPVNAPTQGAGSRMGRDRWSGEEGFEDLAVSRVDLQESLLSLPRRQREVLILRYLADLSEAQTAAVLGCSVGAVKRHSARARSSLGGHFHRREET